LFRQEKVKSGSPSHSGKLNIEYADCKLSPTMLTMLRVFLSIL